MIEDGRPRFWIDWYDRWNLILPILVLASAGWLVTRPRPAQPWVPPAPARPAMAPLSNTTLESPASGARFVPDRLGDVEGRAQPGSVAVLFYSMAPSVERRELSRMPVGADGRYRFRLSRFPPGVYVIQVIAYAADGRTAASSPVDVWVVQPPAKPVAKPPGPTRRRP